MIIVAILLLPLTGRLIHLYYTQGVALGWELLGFQPVRYTLSIICLHPTTNIPPNGLDICLCQQRAESPMASIAQGNALGKRYLGGCAL